MTNLIVKALATGVITSLAVSPKIESHTPPITTSNFVEVESVHKDLRVETLEEFLAGYNSPLKDHAETFVKVADDHNLDWRFMPAIAGMESLFGNRVAYNSYNPFGWGGGYIYFNSWEESIKTVGKSLGERSAKYNRYGPEAWARIYCPPNYHNWTKGVNYFKKEINQLYLQKLTEGGAVIAAAR